MRRIVQVPRPDWRRSVEAAGLLFHSEIGAGSDAQPSWNEAAAYVLSPGEAATVEAAAAELHRLCLAATDHMAGSDALLALSGIPKAWWGAVRASLRRGDPSLCGRLDLAFGGGGPPKLLEYNADTAHCMIEITAQAGWRDELWPGAGQLSALRPRLVARLRALREERFAGEGAPAFHASAIADGWEDEGTALFIAACAAEAGWEASFLPLAGVGWDGRRFVDLDSRPVRAWFKLYPWEWAMADPFGRHLRRAVTDGALLVLEPAWKILLSSKALLPVLWRLNPGHSNLLPAWFDEGEARDSPSGRYVAKPILAREGANVALREGGRTLAETGGPYGGSRAVFQAAATLFQVDGRHAILGAWIVGSEPAGLIVREDASPIITNRSQVVPHLVMTG